MRSVNFGCLPYLCKGSSGSSRDSIVSVSLPSSSEMSNDWFRILFKGDERSGVTSLESGIFRFLFFEAPTIPSPSSRNICMVSFVGVLRPLRFNAEAVISLNACLDAPMRPPRSRDDLGVKKRVKDLGVIVGALRGLLPCCLLRLGSTGEEHRSSPCVEVVPLDRGFSCDPRGVWSSILYN